MLNVSSSRLTMSSTYQLLYFGIFIKQIQAKQLSLFLADAPRFPSVSLSSSGKIVEGSSVTLICSSDANPAGSYTWYKEGEESPKAFGPNFTISNIQNKHSGIYSCKVQNKIGHHNSTLSVTVVAGKPLFSVAPFLIYIGKKSRYYVCIWGMVHLDVAVELHARHT